MFKKNYISLDIKSDFVNMVWINFVLSWTDYLHYGPDHLLHTLQKKKFMLDEMFQRNASKFAIFLEYENPRNFFRFSFHFISFHFISCYFIFSPNECPSLCRHSLEEKSSTKWKSEKATWVFIFQKYGKFWSILLGHFIKH